MTGDLDYRDRAACATVTPRTFFPEHTDQRTIRRAKAICARCPVRDECLADALAGPERDYLGIWGGTTATDRRRLRKGVPS